MDGREVRPDDFGRWVKIAHLHGPDACAGAEVEDPLGFGGQLGDAGAGLAVQGEHEDVVDEVETLLLLLVVGEEVLARAVGMVAPAVLVLEVEDGRVDRRRGRHVAVVIGCRVRRNRVAVLVVRCRVLGLDVGAGLVDRRGRRRCYPDPTTTS